MAKSPNKSECGWLSVRQFAEAVGVTPRTVHSWRKLRLVSARLLPSGRYEVHASEVARLRARPGDAV